MYVHGLAAENLASYRIIQVVRDPLARFVSAWKHQERILGEKMDLQVLLEKLERYKSLLPQRWEAFYQQFYDDPDHQKKSFARGNWGGLRFYMDQVDWNDLDQPVHYFKLEELSADVSKLSELLERSLPPLPIKNKGDYTETTNDSLTRDQRAQIHRLFERDFSTFGYGF
jgi:hypothetical protein